MIDMPILKRVFRFLCFLILSLLVFTCFACSAQARIERNQLEYNHYLYRSIESLRDIDSQTWQVVAYHQGNNNYPYILRIVGYPGTLRLDHPLPLQVNSGRKYWDLEDITLMNPKISHDRREAAAEFDLSPLLKDLNNNRPLRLKLPKVFNDLPIPPYVVKEWRRIGEVTITE